MKAVAFDNADWTSRHDVEIFPGRVTSGVMVGDHISLIVSQSWLVCGRRAGKSFTLALCAVYLATFKDYRAHLAPGERATIMIIAGHRKQSHVTAASVRS